MSEHPNDNLVPSSAPADFLYSPGNRFIDPIKVLAAAGVRQGSVIGDYGAGNGYFAKAASELAGENGTVYAVDIQEAPLRNIMSEARLHNMRNVTTFRCDLQKEGVCPVPAVSCDLVILANILHQVDKPQAVAAAAFKGLKTGGQALIVEWEPTGGVFGPPADTRISEQAVAKIFTDLGFRPGRKIPTDPYHYAVTYVK